MISKFIILLNIKIIESIYDYTLYNILRQKANYIHTDR